MQVITSAPTMVTARKGRNNRHGGMPAAFITMISESVANRLSVWAIAITSATGAMIRTRCGMIRLVIPTNTKTD